MSNFVLPDVVKRPHVKIDYTEQHIRELAQCINDPLYFMRTFMRARHPVRGAGPFIPYDYQVELVNSFQNYRFNIVMASRQIGKTETTVGYMLWKAMFVPDVLIIVAANKFAQALEIVERIKYAYENAPAHIKAGAIDYNKGTLTFDNGSRIMAQTTTPNTGRGLPISLLYVDEFAAVPPKMAKAFWTSIRPTLATGGSCIITSTPQHDEDQFAEIWKGAIDNLDKYGNVRPDGLGSNEFHASFYPWFHHPERDDKWADTERASLGDARFRQEYNCEFVSSDETLINSLVLSRMRASDPLYYVGTSRWYHEPEPNKAYLVALDPACGTMRDFAAIEVFQLPEMIQVAEWQANDLTARHQVRVLLDIMCALDETLRANPEQRNNPEIYWTFENNSIGESILTIIEDSDEDRFPGMLVTERRRKGLQMRRVRRGMHTAQRSKLSACARLKSLIESGRMTIHSTNLIKEFKNFVAVGNTIKAKSGEHDDLVLATLLAVRMLDVALAWGTTPGDLREHISDRDLGEAEIEDEPMPVILPDGDFASPSDGTYNLVF